MFGCNRYRHVAPGPGTGLLAAIAVFKSTLNQVWYDVPWMVVLELRSLVQRHVAAQ